MKKRQSRSAASIEVEPEKSISTLGFHPRQFTQDEATAKFPSVLTCIEKLLKNREQTDTTVVVGSETFECHMIVLKCYSEYFEKLDANTSLDTKTVILPEDQVSSVAFFKIYEWMLSDEEKVERSNFAEVYKAAKFLKIRELMSQLMCCIDDKKVIEEREALSIYLEAKAANEKSLQEFMLKKISKIFLTFVASWEFLVLHFEEAEDLFRSNRLGINSELDMLLAAIRWLQHDWPQRKKSIAGLMSLVRFELMQSWQLVELKRYPKELEHIFKIHDVQNMIDKALSSISLQCSETGAGDEESVSEVFNRRLINDPLWNEFEFEMNPNIHENYLNFCAYLSQLNACHWRKIKYADPKHDSVIL